jgi:pilus assembly protein Flp/PilA
VNLKMLGLYVKLQTWFTGFGERARDERGATAVEYGLLVALIAAVIVLLEKALGSKLSSAFQSVNGALP